MSDNPGSDNAARGVLVAGAAHGIGLATARAFARQGDRVVLADIDGPAVDRAASELRDEGAVAVHAQVDLTSGEGCNAAVAAALRSFSQLDVLVHCVGGFRTAKAVDAIDDGEWERGILLNLTSAFRIARAAAPAIASSPAGRIVFVSSEAGRMPIGVTTAYYAAAKAGVIGLARHLAIELGPSGVTVNVTAPGTTMSERVAAIWDEERQASIVARTPLGRLAELDDQVGPILFLASGAAKYVTGATLDVNGGRLML